MVRPRWSGLNFDLKNINWLALVRGISITPKTGLWGLNLALVSLVGYSMGSITAEGIQSSLSGRTPAVQVRATSTLRQKPRPVRDLTSFESILQANIFHARRTTLSTGGSGEVAVAAGDAPLPLNLTLTGVLMAGPIRFAMVVGPDGHKELVYQEGDCIPGGSNHPSDACSSAQGQVNAVTRSELKVAYQGKLYTYEITARTGNGTSAKPAPKTASNGRPTPAPAAPNTPQGQPFPSTRNGNNIEMRVPGADVSKAFENFAEVLKQARVVPFTSGDLNGFQIRDIVPGSVFHQIGLQNMDVIRSLNGEAITTADQALRLMTAFRNERNIRLEVRRGAEDLALNYNIE
ncbi:MAG: PDZ domain-containing protein [Deltaproteobacteria bacterium]|nr:PDZ domain-containing protein [Deltaproteobacteria bacterium]